MMMMMMMTGRRHTRFCEVFLDGIDIFGKHFVRLLFESGVENFEVLVTGLRFVRLPLENGVLARDQTTVLVEVMTSHPHVAEDILKKEIGD